MNKFGEMCDFVKFAKLSSFTVYYTSGTVELCLRLDCISSLYLYTYGDCGILYCLALCYASLFNRFHDILKIVYLIQSFTKKKAKSLVSF